MIIMQLLGGLGNQLFQYALGRRLAHDHNIPLKLDISGFEAYPLRVYSLQHFHIQADIASFDDLQPYQGRGIQKRTQRWLSSQLRPYWRQSIVFEHGYGFHPEILQARAGYLIGYWQSHKYFEAIASIIRDDFQLKTPPDANTQHLSETIQQISSVSLHIRRGDYVTNQETQSVHGVMSLDYYHEAVKRIAALVVDPQFFIFSDDPNWAIDNLQLKYPMTVVSGNYGTNDYDDLHLLSLCKHHIIANSSFSWWGAWLSNHADKIVVAPSRWTILPEGNTSDRIPVSWIQI